MINTYAYDVEVLPNFFSITFVDIKSYLVEFKDACVINKKGKRTPIPLCQKYSVKEIKEKLAKVKKVGFYITDTDDRQLLPMVGFINQMQAYYDKSNNPVVTHLFGYNSMSYDKLMIAGLLSYFNIFKSTRELIYHLYELSQKIISSQDNRELSKNDFMLKSMRTFKLPYLDIDVMRIFALNKVGKGVDANGNTIFFSKGLKQTSINLQWYELLEYDLPPISDYDRFLYNEPKYANRSNEELNKLINKWDRYIMPDWIQPTMHYNLNDVYIVCEMIRLNMDEINLRYKISSTYEVDVYSSSRSQIADRLFEKFYSEFSGLEPYQWKGKKTDRTIMSFKRIILPFIKFKTPILQSLLEEMKHTSVTSLGKDSFKKEITINKLTYTVATGGLHSQDIPRELKSKLKYLSDSLTGNCVWDNISDDSYIYLHWDISDAVPR